MVLGIIVSDGSKEFPTPCDNNKFLDIFLEGDIYELQSMPLV